MKQTCYKNAKQGS